MTASTYLPALEQGAMKNTPAVFQKAHLHPALRGVVAQQAEIKIGIVEHFVENGLQNVSPLF